MTTDPNPPGPTPGPAPRQRHFIEQIVEDDGRSGKFNGRVQTRFPPEPNGYLHIGHAKSICLNFGLAEAFGGKFNLRFDDTNPAKEEQEYVDAIKADVKWLGADFDGPHGGGVHWASGYFGRMYDLAVELIRQGKAYVCDLSAEQVAEFRGPPTRPGRPSPFRDRGVDENLDLFARMRAGEFPNGSKTLRARIDLPGVAAMSSPNLNLRDPVMYRVLHEPHHHTGTAWRIYPMYDWAHGLEDRQEGVTHSVCTLEFENNRPLYDWFLDALGAEFPDRPQQIEFARLNLTYTVMSKRFLLSLVREGRVTGWDDPRMPTLAGYRRRGYTPESIRAFCEDVGVTRTNSLIDVGRLEGAVRSHLNRVAPRFMAVLRPLKVTIEGWPEGRVDWLDAVNNPEDPGAGSRKVPFSGTLYIERDDFMESPPKKFFRLAPGVEVRLRWAYFVTCTGVVKNPATGDVIEVRCSYDPATRGGDAPAGADGSPPRKPKATIHWVSAGEAAGAEVRLFDRLFRTEEPGKANGGDHLADLNPASLEVVKDAKLEPALAQLSPGDRVQFERLGYFCVDRDSRPGAPVFNRTVTLRDAWAKEAAKGG